jgi:hypothetical protein
MWDAALATARSIDDLDMRVYALRAVAKSLTDAGHIEQMRALIQDSWREATTYQEMWGLLSLARFFIVADPALLPALIAGADWVTEFLQTPT